MIAKRRLPQNSSPPSSSRSCPGTQQQQQQQQKRSDGPQRSHSRSVLMFGGGGLLAVLLYCLALHILSVQQEAATDAIIVGSGLAGMAAALHLLDRGGSVILLEKEHTLGGNSNKASSGINACCNDDNNDTLDLFKRDTVRSAGSAAQPPLIDVLVENSAHYVQWLQERLGLDLSVLSQLGGHSVQRTHRPKQGMVGAEIIYDLQKAIATHERVRILTDSTVTRVLYSSGRVTGVEYTTHSSRSGRTRRSKIYAPHVVLATGGFASDRSSGSLLERYRPELLKLPTTAGAFSTGDGIALATRLGAGLVDMDKVQLHPTGWVDPADAANPSKVLAAEVLRGVGGLLINDNGERFCNELGLRSYVTEKMLQHDKEYAATGKWSPLAEPPTFALILPSAAAREAQKHVDHYTGKGLMTKLQGVQALANWMRVDKSTLVSTLDGYRWGAAADRPDKFGKTSFRGVPADDLDNEVFYAGRVTPVLHYCMGGLTIDTTGNVLNDEGEIIPGLHAAGEVSGGVHGNNRLGGNSLLECAVFGSIVGQQIPIRKSATRVASTPTVSKMKAKKARPRTVSLTELQRHNTPTDCWLAIHGVVYDLTLFADEHPAGKSPIHMFAGKDATDTFDVIHNKRILERFDKEKIGKLAKGGSVMATDTR